MATSQVFNPTHDPLYNVYSKNPAVDADTVYRSSRRIPASSFGNGSLEDPLNGKKTTFNYSYASNMKNRHDTTRLKVVTQITNVDGDDTAIACAPAWNIFGSLIQEITLKKNSHGTPLYTKSNGQYLMDFTVRMLKQFTIEEMEKMGNVFCLPIRGDNQLLRGAIDITTDDDIDGFMKRSERYVGTNSDDRFLVFDVPYNLLFPAWANGILQNDRSTQIDITWASLTNAAKGLEILSYTPEGGQKTLGEGVIRVISCEVVTDDYALSTSQSMSILNDKTEGQSDIVAFYDTVIDSRKWDGMGTSIPITNQDMIQDVFVLQPAKITHSDYASIGQFVFFNTVGTGDRLSNDQILTTRPNKVESLQMTYGGLQFPPSPIELKRGDGTSAQLDVSELYFEHEKACGKLNDRTTGQMMDYNHFTQFMPFIHLRPWSNLPKLNQTPQDLYIKLQGTPATHETANYLQYVLTKLVVFKINVDGTIVAQQS